MTSALTAPTQVVSAARFYVEFTLLGKIAFSELNGITSKVASSEYIYNDDKGATFHTKQFGKTDPPQITLRRGLDAEGNAKLLGWHQLARDGDPTARDDGYLIIMDAHGSTDRQVKYLIHQGWCSELQVTGMKAGDSQVTMIEVKITCEKIEIIKN